MARATHAHLEIQFGRLLAAQPIAYGATDQPGAPARFGDVRAQPQQLRANPGADLVEGGERVNRRGHAVRCDVGRIEGE